MAINRVEIKDFLVFKGEFAVDFCPGVNVLIGGNGTGKTTLIKLMYMACDYAKKKQKISLVGVEKSELIKFEFISLYFPLINNDLVAVLGFAEDKDTIYLQKNQMNIIIADGTAPETNISLYGVSDEVSSVFIPTNDMLSHAKGFLALYKERDLPFDQTFADILSKAELPITREVTTVAANVIDKIRSVIGGEVVYENDVFYIQKESGEKTPFSLEASGYRKLGLLWKLLRNGLLESGNILFWDEPENSLSPEQVPILVDILLELSRNGVQVFVATHSEILASYFAVNREKGDIVLFTSLYKDGEQIKANSSDRFDLLEPNKLTAEIINLYEKEIVKGFGGNV